MENEEDIVEHALNWGKRFHVSDETVKTAVFRFAIPMFTPCQCEKHMLETGHAVMCFMCTGRTGCLTLNERLCKIGVGSLLR